MDMSNKGDLRTANDREACGINVADQPARDSRLARKQPFNKNSFIARPGGIVAALGAALKSNSRRTRAS